jgi:hypothetical protein
VGRGLLRGSAFHLRLGGGGRFTAPAQRAPGTGGTSWLTYGELGLSASAFPRRDPLLIGIHSWRGVVAHFDWVRVPAKP